LSEQHDSELRMAVAEGLLSREEAEAIKEEASRLGRNPIELLVERGRLSADTLASLRREATSEPARDTDEPARDTGEPPDDAATLQLTPREERGADVPGFPVTDWKRYQCLRLLGQGGMGRVFLARDMQLRRNVALKFVRDDDPDNMNRFISEARSQARVSHERVCQVYEVGEVQGRTYIAMQHIDGSTLNQLAKELTLEQKVLVMREVAEGVHAAHRAGLIHRDIKPSNIMVERSDSGLLKPYVMDFGLARDWKEGMTATGSIMGTPHYMAPEQARGEVSRLDRRADVYSLGATLYHLLTGVVPIPGSNSLEVLNNISAVEPRPPRSVDKDIPADLEAIILKCMEKERSARYDSARALAEELERFLNGDPVLARAPGLWYRLRKRARKHKAVVAVASGALVLLVSGLGVAGLKLREAKQQAALELRSAELVASIEDLSRHPYLLPLHDTSADRERIRTWMRELKAGPCTADSPDAAAVHYALGMGHLALGKSDTAQTCLESAWALGYQKPRSAYALALVLGHRYQEQLLVAERDYRQQRGQDSANPSAAEQQREARKRQLEQRYRDPALFYLKRSEGAPVPPGYVAALLAFHEGRFGDALARLDELGGKPLGFYQAPKLRGDILLASAVQHWNQGRPEQANAEFDAARQAYAQAADIGRSDPFVLHAMARLESAVVDMEVYKSRMVERPFERGLQAVERALIAAPDHYDALVLKARLHRRLAQAQAIAGQDTHEASQKGLEASEAASKLAPERPEAWLEMGRAYWRLGRSLLSKTEDPSERFRQAQDALKHVDAKDQDHEFHLQRGLIHKTSADYEARSGADPLPNLDKAIDSYRKILQMNEGLTSIWINLVSAQLTRAEQPNNPDPFGDLEQARVALEKARAGNPHHIQLFEYEGLYHEQLAKQTRKQGGKARPHWEKAREAYEQGLLLHDKSETLLLNQGVALLELSQEAWDQGSDPSPWVAQSQAVFEKARLLAPGKLFAYSSLGVVNARRAAYQLAREENPLTSLRAAQQFYRQALERAPQNAQTWSNLGRSFQLLAAFELEQGGDPRKNIAEAFAALRHALGLTPSNAEARAYLAEVQALEARWKARQGQAQPQDFATAEASFRSALALAPKDQDIRLAFGRFFRERATWQKQMRQPSHLSLEQGLKLVDTLLEERPHWADALLLRASLTLTREEGAAPPETRALDQTRKDITQALASNRNLEREARHLLSRLKKLPGESRASPP
jgi:serine/threonine-protein kinase